MFKYIFMTGLIAISLSGMDNKNDAPEPTAQTTWDTIDNANRDMPDASTPYYPLITDGNDYYLPPSRVDDDNNLPEKP